MGKPCAARSRCDAVGTYLLGSDSTHTSGVLRSASFVRGEKEEWEFQAPVSEAAD